MTRDSIGFGFSATRGEQPHRCQHLTRIGAASGLLGGTHIVPLASMRCAGASAIVAVPPLAAPAVAQNTPRHERPLRGHRCRPAPSSAHLDPPPAA